jgi:hypothetical protein
MASNTPKSSMSREPSAAEIMAIVNEESSFWRRKVTDYERERMVADLVNMLKRTMDERDQALSTIATMEAMEKKARREHPPEAVSPCR